MTKPVLGFLAAIIITTTMDATGYSMFSALPLLPLTLIFWAWQRLSRQEMGLTWGTLQGYAIALLHPVMVMGPLIAIAVVVGAIDLAEADWGKAGLNIGLGSTVGILGVLLTEEGFFRGWLYGSLERAGKSGWQAVVWSSVAFTLWHVSAISLETGFNVPLPQIPVYLIMATAIGLLWGMLRMMTGSVLVPSVAHAVWNALAYTLFGFGEKVGVLGIERTDIYGPEVGLLGMAFNVIFVGAVWLWIRRGGIHRGEIRREG